VSPLKLVICGVPTIDWNDRDIGSPANHFFDYCVDTKQIIRVMRIRSSLRTLFVLMTIAALLLGICAHRAARQQSAIAAVEKLGGNVFYDYQCDDHGNPNWGNWDQLPYAYVIPRSLVAQWGGDYFNDVACVNLNGRSITDDDLKQLAPLARILQLSLANTNITDDGLAYLKGFDDLRRVDLSGTKITSAGVSALKRALPTAIVQEDVKFQELIQLIQSTVHVSSDWTDSTDCK
jgi:Leucine Rich repeat